MIPAIAWLTKTGESPLLSAHSKNMGIEATHSQGHGGENEALPWLQGHNSLEVSVMHSTLIEEIHKLLNVTSLHFLIHIGRNGLV